MATPCEYCSACGEVTGVELRRACGCTLVYCRQCHRWLETIFDEDDVADESPLKTWADYKRDCLSTFHGGYHESDLLDAFQHGMETVFNLLEAEVNRVSVRYAHPLNYARYRQEKGG